MALKNRPGDVAADFVYVDRSGRAGRLSAVEAPYIILYFNDPDCDDCRRTKASLMASPVISSRLQRGEAVVLSVCVEGKTASWKNAVYPDHWIDAADENRQLTLERVYDLKAMPTLYLLDADKRVILKDVPVERIEAWLSRH